MKNIQSARGTRDILPEDQVYWDFLSNVIEKKVSAFGFDKITLPIFEDSSIFTRAIGNTTDIVEKELFGLSRLSNLVKDDEDKAQLALRPEGTAGAVRAYLEHGMASWTQPVRLWYQGPMFRYERPQKGRYREFRQLGVELIGEGSPASDALVILLLWEILVDLGLKDKVIIDINSLGDKNCRARIKQTLTQYFTKFKKNLCTDCQRRLETNPLRLLDCKEASCQPIKAGAPQIVDLLDDECKQHFQSVLEYLDELNIPYDLNRYLVRGLDYYTRTAFEVREIGDNRRQSSLGGGGRYDELIGFYSQKETPAVGFALGLDRLIDLIKTNNIKLPSPKKPDVCIIQIGDIARRFALCLVQEITRAGYNVVTTPGKDSLKGQMRVANKAQAKVALIIGQKEALDKSVIIKDLEDGSQETITQKNLIKRLKEKLSE